MRLAALLLSLPLLALSLWAQPSTRWILPQHYTVATLPAAGVPFRVVFVTDATSASTCSSGGGSTVVMCRDTGSAWAVVSAGGGGGSGCVTSGSNNQVITDDGAGGCVSEAALQFAAGVLSVGTPGSVVGDVALGNATSGTVTLRPVTGALGTSVLSLPAATDTVALLAATQTFTNKTLTAPIMTAPVLGTPASGTATNLTGLPISTGVSGLGTGVATALGTPSSANFAAAVTDETGSGAMVFGTSPTITTPTISGAITFPDDVAQTFNPGTTNSGLNVGSIAGDPSAPANGDLWYDSTANELTARINGTNVALGAGGGGGITSLEGQTGATQTFTDDTNVTIVSGSNAHVITWAGTLAVARGGTGAGTLTGLLQGNGTSAVTAITDSSTAGQVLRVTGASTYAWGALDLADADAVTGLLPAANLALRTFRVPMLSGQTMPDTSGNVFMEPYTIKATNDFWGYNVWIFNDTSTDLKLYTVIETPENFVSGAKACVVWTSTATSGNVVWGAPYRVIAADDTNSLDQSTAGTTPTAVTDAAPTAANRRLRTCITLTDSDFSSLGTLQLNFQRNGTSGSDTMAAAAIVHAVEFEYQGR